MTGTEVEPFKAAIILRFMTEWPMVAYALVIVAALLIIGYAWLRIPLGPVSRIWVAAVAYDAQGNVVGVRRYEAQTNSARPLEHGQALSIQMSVYSASKKIERVELISEARP